MFRVLIHRIKDQHRENHMDLAGMPGLFLFSEIPEIVRWFKVNVFRYRILVLGFVGYRE